MRKAKLVVYVLEHRENLVGFDGRTRSGYVLRTAGGDLVETYTGCSKVGAVIGATARMRAFWDVAKQESELRIRRRDGTFSPARTYPRSADPKRSKG